MFLNEGFIIIVYYVVQKTNQNDFNRNTAGYELLYLKICVAAQFDLYNLVSYIQFHYIILILLHWYPFVNCLPK